MSTLIKLIYDGNFENINDYVSKSNKDSFLKMLNEQDFLQTNAIFLLSTVNNQSIIDKAIANKYDVNSKGTNG